MALKRGERPRREWAGGTSADREAFAARKRARDRKHESRQGITADNNETEAKSGCLTARHQRRYESCHRPSSASRLELSYRRRVAATSAFRCLQFRRVGYFGVTTLRERPTPDSGGALQSRVSSSALRCRCLRSVAGTISAFGLWLYSRFAPLTIHWPTLDDS
jgi:hypothetical protein